MKFFDMNLARCALVAMPTLSTLMVVGTASHADTIGEVTAMTVCTVNYTTNKVIKCRHPKVFPIKGTMRESEPGNSQKKPVGNSTSRFHLDL